MHQQIRDRCGENEQGQGIDAAVDDAAPPDFEPPAPSVGVIGASLAQDNGYDRDTGDRTDRQAPLQVVPPEVMQGDSIGG